MELKHLRHFVAVVDEGTFSKAAEAAAISQPALTRSIQALESRLGISLLDRNTRGLELTPQGAKFYERAKLILNETALALSELKSGPKSVTPFRIGLAPMFAGDILPAAIGTFSLDHPELAVSVHTGLFTDLSERLAQGGLDLVFSNLPFATVSDALQIKPMLDIDVCYVASAKHPLAKQSRISFETLSAHPWAVIDDANSNALYSYIFNLEGETQSPIKMTTNSLSYLRELVKHPPWITLLPRHMATGQSAKTSLVILDTATDKLKRKAGIIVRKTKTQSPAIKAFTAYIKERLSEAWPTPQR